MNATPTNASAALGALVAAQQCLELDAILRERVDGRVPPPNFEVYQDPLHHRHYLSSYVRNPLCRFDHQSWELEHIHAPTVESIFVGCGPDAELSLEGDRFAWELSCAECGLSRSMLGLVGRMREDQRVCPACSAICIPSGFASSNTLALKKLNESALRSPPPSLGLEKNDVVTVTASDGSTHHRILGGQSPVGPSVILIGCGNIGSQVVPHLARLDGIERVVVIDPDRYESGNLVGQAIRTCDVGKPKVEVAAETIHSIAPSLPVLAIQAAVEHAPLGFFAGAIVIAAVDSRAARMQINQMAWRVASYWIDGAVDGPSRLASIGVYRPCESSACYECGFDDDDYAAIEQVYSCVVSRSSEPNIAGHTDSD